MRKIAILVPAVLALSVVSPAAPAADPLSYLPPDARAEISALRERAAETRAAVQGDSFVRRLTALLAAQGAKVPDVPPLPAPAAGVPLPAPLGAPVAGLSAAVRAAEDLLAPLPRHRMQRDLAAILDALTHPKPVQSGAAPFPSVGGGVAPAETVLPEVDTSHLGTIHHAALLVAAALDRYLPPLREAAASPPPAPAAPHAPACDLVDEPPLLCVGGPGDNAYGDDVMLLIDVGGDDRYRNMAGGAPFLTQDGSACVPVSVNVDLAGNDRYVATRPSPCDPFVNRIVAQGAAAEGGVGFLVDLDGNDQYLVEGAPPPSSSIAQGMGAFGTGMLLDAGGRDRYLQTGPAENGSAGVAGQGMGVVGLGVLADLGGAEDRYALHAGHLDGDPHGEGFPARMAFGQGVGGIAGIGALVDDGGNGRVAMSASTRRVGLDSYPENQESPIAQLVGQGFGSNLLAAQGLGLMLSGEGDTTYEMLASGEGLVWNRIQGQAYADLLGAAVLDDLGGNDRYVMRAEMRYDREIVVDDSCRIPDGDVCPFAQAEVSAARPTITNEVHGQGHGLDATALIEDHAGNDAYEALSVAALDVTLHDRLSNPVRPPRLDVRGYSTTALLAQGASNVGASILIDAEGSDRYSAESSFPTRATATTERAMGTPEAIAFGNHMGFTSAQGGTFFQESVGALLDLGGDGDRFRAIQANEVTTLPDPRGAFQAGPTWPQFQGAGSGTSAAILVALGHEPVIVSSPSRPVCAGVPRARGFGEWAECRVGTSEDASGAPVDGSSVVGGGAAPHNSGMAPLLEITPDTPATAPVDRHQTFEMDVPRVRVGARLLDAGGHPIAGARLHFDWQFSCRLPCAIVPDVETPITFDWANAFEMEATTGDDGIAYADLPFHDSAFLFDNFPHLEYRFAATYDGDADEYPRLAAKEFRLVE